MPRGRALALATAYVVGIADDVRHARHDLRASRHARSGRFLANPWVIVPLALFFVAMGLSMFGAFEVALPVGAAGAPVARRRPRLRRRVPDGARRRDHRRPLHRAAAGVAARVRHHDARRSLGVRCCSRPTAPASACRSGCWPAFSMSLPRPGALDGVGEERVRHRALHGGALLPQERRPRAGAVHARPTPRFALTMAALVLAGVALGAIHASFHGGAAERVRKALGVGLATIGLFGATNYLLTPKGDVEARLALRRAGRRRRRRAPPAARCWSTSPPAGASPARSSR